MSSKHYKEQKMLIENFNKWINEEECGEKEIEETSGHYMEAEPIEEKDKELDEVFGLGGEFGDGWVVWDLLQLMVLPTAIFYTLGPYLKIAVHHPSVQNILMNQDSEGDNVLRAMAVGLKGADNAGQWLQDFADKIYGRAKDGEKSGITARLRNAMALFAFLIVLSTTSFPIILSMAARVLPRISLFLKKQFASNKKKEIGSEETEEGPTAEEELKELEMLEQENRNAQQAATAVSEVMEMIKQDPLKIAQQLGVELSEQDIKHLKIDPESDPETPKKPRSRAKKVDIPMSKGEEAARRGRIAAQVFGQQRPPQED